MTSSPLLKLDDIQKVFYTDEVETHALSGIHVEIARGEYGRILRADKSDLRLLQRIIDDELIRPVETQKLQALGVVLGDVFVAELGLVWRTFEDPRGKSRAVCLKDNRECLFPVTMISKRIEFDQKPNIEELFERGRGRMQPFLPKLPYSAR